MTLELVMAECAVDNVTKFMDYKQDDCLQHLLTAFSSVLKEMTLQ